MRKTRKFKDRETVQKIKINLCKKHKNIDYETFKYICPWCNFEFKREVRTVGLNKHQLGDKHGRMSTHIICPNCKNGVKTWNG